MAITINGKEYDETKLSDDVKNSILQVQNSNNTVSIIYDIDLGEKAKIRKIKFIGDKKYKNR